MSRFINGLYDLTVQNFLISRMCQSFAEACMVVVTFKDSTIRLRISILAPTNNREKRTEPTPQTPSRPPRIIRPQAYAQRENVRSAVCNDHHTWHECPLLYQWRPQNCKWCEALVIHSKENCWKAPNGRYGQMLVVEYPTVIPTTPSITKLRWGQGGGEEDGGLWAIILFWLFPFTLVLYDYD